MPPVRTASDTLTCPHGGQVSHVPSQVRVQLDGSPALTTADVGTVLGCAFTLPGGAPSPCVTVRWSPGAPRVLTPAGPLLTASDTGLCANPQQAPQGTAAGPPPPPRVQVG